MEVGWWITQIKMAIKQSQNFDVLMVSNGHHNVPKYPEYPGTYTGKFLHSHDFKGVDESWRDKRVLVIGAGNSACDISVEAARITKTVHMSMRSPQWFFPKFIFGQPGDVFAARSKWLPKKLRQYGLKTLVRLIQGPTAAMAYLKIRHLPLKHPSNLELRSNGLHQTWPN
jgi:cation diffusion facilitator CzcD-associated flavoprotein CzcO